MCSLYRREHYRTLSHRRLCHRGRAGDAPYVGCPTQIVQLKDVQANVRFRSKADMCSAKQHVRFTPESGHVQCNSVCPLCANSGHRGPYSITSSARARSVGGTAMPSAFAVLRLISSSNVVGCVTGKSAGLVPLRMRPA